MLAHEPSHAAAKCQSSDTGIGHCAASRRETMGLGGVVQISPQDPTFSSSGAFHGIDADRLHQGQVNYQSTIIGAVTRGAVTTTTDRCQQVPRTREPDGL